MMADMSHRDKIEYEKDTEVLAKIKQLCYGILDYYAWKQDSSEIHEAEFNEVIDLSYINEPEIYKLMLLNVFKDVSNDPFIYPYKFVGLAVCILNLSVKLSKTVHYTDYASADDLN